MILNLSTFTKLNEIPALTGLVILIGPPGSGKSTFAKRLVQQQAMESSSYISNDKIAKEMFGVTINRGDKDGEIFTEQDRQIAALLEAGKVAIVDATNVRSEARQRLINIAEKYSRPVTALCFRRNNETLIKQNKGREVKVPEAMVLEYAELMHHINRETLQDEGITLVIDIPPDM